MKCPKCGAETEEGALFCPACGVAIPALTESPAPQSPMEGSEPIPTAGAPEPVGFATPDFSDASPAKKKKTPFILLAAGVILLVLVVAAALNFGALRGAMIRSFGSDAQYFSYVENKALHNASALLSEAYGAAFVESPSRQSLAVKSTAKPYVSDQAQTLLKTFGFDADLSWIDGLELTSLIRLEDTLSATDYDLSYAGHPIVHFGMLMDLVAEDLYFSIPEISDLILCIRDETYLDSASEPSTWLPETPPTLSQLREALPSDVQVQKLLRKYGKIILDTIRTVSKTEDVLTVEDLSQKCTVLQVNVIQSLMCDFAEAVLNAAKEDAELEKILNNLQAKLTELGQDTGSENLYTKFLEGIDEALEEVSKERDEITEDSTVFVLQDFVDSKHQILGRKITRDGETIASYVRLTDGDRYATQLTLEAYTCTGSGTVKGGKLSGEFRLATSDSELLKVSLTDADIARTSKGTFSGTYRIAPGSYLFTMIGEDDPSTAAVLSLMDPALELKIDAAKGSVATELNLLSGQNPIAGLRIQAAPTDGEAIVLPQDAVVWNWEETGAEIIQSVHFDKLIENMEDAGLPEGVTEVVDELLQEISFILALLQMAFGNTGY